MNKYLTLLFLMVPLVLSGQTFNVGDYTINKKTAASGPLTPKYWAGANSTLWGTNGSGDPQSITIGSGLNLTGSTLTATGGGGDVVGPASATDNAIVRFDLTTGKLLQNSGITIADGASGTLSGTNTGDLTLNATITDIFSLSGQELTADDPGADRLLFWDDSDGKLTYLTIGSGLSITGTTITATGSGDVTGPASSTDNAIARFDLTTGKVIQNSGITIADGATGTLSGTNSGDVTVLDGNTINFTLAGQQITAEAITQLSITSDASGLKLVGDVNAPGNSYYYGTDGTGTKGYFALPSGVPGGSDTQLQYNNAGSFGGMSGTSWDNTNRSLTITGATVTASEPIFDLTQTWNNGLVTFTGIKLNVTDTASAADSLLLDLQTGATSQFRVFKSGSIAFNGDTDASIGYRSDVDMLLLGDVSGSNGQVGISAGALGFGITQSAANYLAWTNSGAASPQDVQLWRDEAYVLAQRVDTNPQTFRLYETYTDSSNYERMAISAAAGTNTIKPEAAGTGTASKIDYHLTATDVRITSGTGSPEGSVPAGVSSIYLRTDGGTNTAVYRKESGTGNTGWVAIANGSGTGDVVGPASATDEAIARFDLTTGKLLQNSVVTITDAGIVAGVTQLNVDNLRLDGNTLSSTDANGNINLTPNGTGVVATSTIRASGSGGLALQNSGGTSLVSLGSGGGVNASIAAPLNTGTDQADYHQIAGGTGTITDTATGSSTNIDINLVPKGTGRVQGGGVNIPTISSTDTFTNKTLGASTSVTSSISWGDGVKQTFNPDGTNAGINVGSQAGDPSTPANGDLWYDSTANELTARINGANVALGAGSSGGVLYKRKGSDQSTSSTTPADVSGIDISLAANTAYRVEWRYFYTASASGEGHTITLVTPTSPTSVDFESQINSGGSGANAVRIALQANGATATTPASAGSTVRVGTVIGTIVNGANAGTLKLQVATETNTTGTTTIKAGSTVTYEVITAAP